MSIDGIDVEVTESLETALRYLLRRRKTVTLWTNRVCINLDDNVEEGYQIALMRDIYSKASKTLVWLGESADGSDELMDAWLDPVFLCGHKRVPAC